RCEPARDQRHGGQILFSRARRVSHLFRHGRAADVAPGRPVWEAVVHASVSWNARAANSACSLPRGGGGGGGGGPAYEGKRLDAPSLSPPRKRGRGRCGTAGRTSSPQPAGRE